MSQFDIGGDGTLRPKTPDSVATGTPPSPSRSLPTATTPSSSTSGDDHGLHLRRRCAGALTFASSADTGAGPAQIVVSPDGASAYVTNFSAGSVSQYESPLAAR